MVISPCETVFLCWLGDRGEMLNVLGCLLISCWPRSEAVLSIFHLVEQIHLVCSLFGPFGYSNLNRGEKDIESPMMFADPVISYNPISSYYNSDHILPDFFVFACPSVRSLSKPHDYKPLSRSILLLAYNPSPPNYIRNAPNQKKKVIHSSLKKILSIPFHSGPSSSISS